MNYCFEITYNWQNCNPRNCCNLFPQLSKDKQVFISKNRQQTEQCILMSLQQPVKQSPLNIPRKNNRWWFKKKKRITIRTKHCTNFIYLNKNFIIYLNIFPDNFLNPTQSPMTNMKALPKQALPQLHPKILGIIVFHWYTIIPLIFMFQCAQRTVQ